MGWLYAIFGLAMDWLLAGYWVSISGYQLAIGWIWPNINTLQDIVIYYSVPKLDMPADNTLDCSVFTRLFAMAGYCPKSINFKT